MTANASRTGTEADAVLLLFLEFGELFEVALCAPALDLDFFPELIFDEVSHPSHIIQLKDIKDTIIIENVLRIVDSI